MPHAPARSAMAAVAALAVVLAACGDDVTDPDAFLESAEAEAVARSAEALPGLHELAAAAGPLSALDRATLDRAAELWAGGAAASGPGGLERRRLAAVQAAPVLARTVPAETWVEARDRTGAWAETAERMLRRLPLPAVEARVGVARAHLARSDAETDAEYRAYYLILATAELLETTPRQVARSLVADARAAVQAAPESRGDRSADRSMERARRLADWAGRAFDDGDYVRSIQRAYYAIQLVEGR